MHVQFSSVTQLCQNLCDPMDCSTTGFPVLHHLLELAQPHVQQVSDTIQISCPLSSPSSAFNLSQHQRLFQRVGSLHHVAEVFSFSISPSNDYSGLIFFRMDWLDLLAVQEALKCLFQHHSSRASILRCSAFFIFQLSHSLQRNPRVDLLQNGLVGSLCSPRDSQESSPKPQFKSISPLALGFLYGPTLTSIHDYWKNHSRD